MLKESKVFLEGYDNKAYEVGKGEGRYKIYNKKLESDLKIAGDLTRVEISKLLDDYPINKINLYKFGDKFPEIYLNQYNVI